jgi:hypothetical protein
MWVCPPYALVEKYQVFGRFLVQSHCFYHTEYEMDLDVFRFVQEHPLLFLRKNEDVHPRYLAKYVRFIGPCTALVVADGKAA